MPEVEIFGLTITRTKAPVSPISHTDRGWHSLIMEPFAGAWQRNIIGRMPKNVLTHSAVYACVTLIASDIGKLRLKLVELTDDGIWVETENGSHSPVLRKPNRFQTRQKFIEHWIVSKLINGNAYVLKERDARGVVRAMYVLDPTRCKPLVAPDGSVFYQIGADNLAGTEGVTVPASEIIHDVMVPLYHPLCGVSPITACALPACHGLNIQEHSATFFANAANPGGILTAPGHINEETAKLLKKQWEERYSGENVGRILVAGDGLKYERMAVNATDAQLIEQLKWTAEQVCTCFHVPAYMVGVGPPPSYNNIGALNTQYYAQCLQSLIESIEALLDEGLGLTETERKLGTELDLDDLLRMDQSTLVETLSKSNGAFITSPDEARKKLGYGPVPGGKSPLAQQQNFSLAALAKRDAKDDPFGSGPAPTPKPPAADDEEDDDSDEDVTRALAEAIERKFHETRLAA